MKALVKDTKFLHEISPSYLFESGCGTVPGNVLEEHYRFGRHAAHKLLRRVSQYECPDSQLDKKSWVAKLIQHKWDARRLSRSTRLASAPAKAVRL